MPPRAVTLGIVALWLAAVGWAVHRRWGAEPAPPALLGRTDEVGRQGPRWRLYRDGKVDAGPGTLEIWRDVGSHLFILSGEFTPQETFTFKGLTVTALQGQYHVTARGRLRGLWCNAVLEGGGPKRVAHLRNGRLEGTRFTAEVSRGGAALERVEAEVPGDVMNLLQPLHRFDGLHEGQRWRTAAFDPLELARSSGPGSRGWPLRELRAEVAPDTLDWHDRRGVPCWRVDYREGDRVSARVWARAADGLVLRQEVIYPDTRTDLVRELTQ
jgi:hypothetical protein